MATNLPLRCACGTLRGTALAVSPRSGTRIVCYCDDCQAFARFLARPDIVDQWGGTDIFQMAPSRVRITSGAEALGCVRLSEKGMHRWYCSECKTPVGNTLGPRVPFVGLIHTFMDHGSDGHARDAALGKPIAYLLTKFAVGTPPSHVRDFGLPRVIGRSVRLIGKWWITGAGLPSPFFEQETRSARVRPRILSPAERSALGRPN